MNLSKEELLEKAKRDYTSNLTIKSAWTGEKFILPGTPDFAFDIDGELFVFNHVYQPFITNKGRWAEILPEEPFLLKSDNQHVDFNSGLKLGITTGELFKVESILAENTRLTQELKEAKAYREKVEAVIEKWEKDSKAYKEQVFPNSHGSGTWAYAKALNFMRDQFKQIK